MSEKVNSCRFFMVCPFVAVLRACYELAIRNFNVCFGQGNFIFGLVLLSGGDKVEYFIVLC